MPPDKYFQIRVELPWATYGITSQNGVVTEAPPIAKWMIGEKTGEVLFWIMNKGGSFSATKAEEG